MSKDGEGAAPPGPVQVYIFNQTYHLRSADDEEYVRRVARLVDERMRHISALAPNHDALKIAVMAALHIADELERMKESHAPEARPEARGGAEPAGGEGGGSWFDQIFESEFTGNRGEERLSARVSERLRHRQERQEPISIEPDEEER